MESENNGPCRLQGSFNKYWMATADLKDTFPLCRELVNVNPHIDSYINKPDELIRLTFFIENVLL